MTTCVTRVLKALGVLVLTCVGALAGYTPPPGCEYLLCSVGATRGKGGLYDTATAPRRQFMDGDDGYCGECTIQVLMTKYGVWLPQEYVRKKATGSAKGDVLVEDQGGGTGNTYRRAFRELGIEAAQFTGSGYQDYIRFVKRHLLRGAGCAIVYQYDGSGYDDYGHIVAVTGIKTATPTDTYDPADVLTVHTHFTRDTVRREVGSYQCGRSRGSWPSVEAGGCVPRARLTEWAWAVLGPVYKGIGPPVELAMDKDRQPGIDRPDRLEGRAIVRGLVPGATYRLYQFADPFKVTANMSSGELVATITARARTASVRVAVPSNRPRYFIAVATT